MNILKSLFRPSVGVKYFSPDVLPKPNDGHFVLLKLADGSEAEGWHNASCGWYRRGGDCRPYTVVGWRELIP